jgi:hypothetical protein
MSNYIKIQECCSVGCDTLESARCVQLFQKIVMIKEYTKQAVPTTIFLLVSFLSSLLFSPEDEVNACVRNISGLLITT